MRYEKHKAIPLTLFQFFLRLLRHGAIAAGIVLWALTVGAFGYHYFEHLGWLDAFLNASFILSGMGPVTCPQTTGGKIFATFYALFSGIMFLTVAAVLFAPVIHRLLHLFHLDMAEREDRGDDRAGRTQ